MVNIDPAFIIFMITTLLIGIPITTTSFFVIRRLRELHKEHMNCEGELFISIDGEMFSEFNIPIEDILNRNYILLKVTKVNPKQQGGNTNVNISA